MMTLWEYVLIFLAAATPWLEAIVVVPLGIIRGLNPWLVSVVAFIGNWLTILLVIIFYEKFQAWREKRRIQKGIETPPESKRQKRARHIWNRYGLPGLALGGPLVIGTHLSALMALAFRSPKYLVTGWITFSLALWIVVFAVGAFYGFSWFQR
ncbi:small multi-drug export protein [Halalkalibacterium halodurans]|uniref:BH1312 protein n=2 Tax=Halalkalibacterium halodurans TaxID=86665 RepID=Q9KDA2_HALH5|nr:small multi-drug export protein [Halalkalibacterium halodurans]MED4080547.1 small multi-drug export protein [Halalkalibacterium halodurans]MED4083831.1 small multi-drug export protein [Halalkalibacterium halodurans]MED4105468.1 small multi-drug export protein [Halalkalibacterium halodurans]MED4109326.1 small multi-drug export protein [Halalkalibacterium halodurans]MED4122490.1 small multi-drug export protein [Halalkalibacterium halodurans]